MEREISVTELRAKLPRLIDEASRGRTSFVITKRGKPVAKLVPIDDGAVDIYGCMAGAGIILGDIVSPIDIEWTADSENVLGERIVFWPEPEA